MYSASGVYREEWIGDFHIIEYSPIELEKPSFALVSLPDTGLVGVIGAMHVVKNLGLREVAGIDSYVYLPPIIVVSGGFLRAPIRVFAGGNLLVVYNEFSLPQHGLIQLSRVLVDYLERRGVDYVILSSGLPAQNRFELESLKTYYLATTPRAIELLKNTNATPFENGFLAGAYALLLKELSRARINTILLLTESFLEFPDPEAAARSIEFVSRIINKPIDVKELLEQAEMIRIKARDAMRNTMRGLAQMRKDVEQAIPIYT
jgi:uncharacterized protein